MIPHTNLSLLSDEELLLAFDNQAHPTTTSAMEYELAARLRAKADEVAEQRALIEVCEDRGVDAKELDALLSALADSDLWEVDDKAAELRKALNLHKQLLSLAEDAGNVAERLAALFITATT